MTKAVHENEFVVQVVRPVFQSTTVRVRADSEEEARLLAVEEASALPATEWTGAFSSEDYTYDCVSVAEIDDDDADAVDCGVESDTKYLLLKADLEAGEGELRLQPWLYHTSELMRADICRDWAGAVSSLTELSDEAWKKFIDDDS